MLLKVVQRIEALLARRMLQKVARYMETLYPDPEDRASAYLAEGADVASTILFGEGEPLKGLTISPEDGGYLISVMEEIDES